MRTSAKENIKKKLIKILKNEHIVAGSLGPITVSRKETTHEDWLKGYWAWKKKK